MGHEHVTLTTVHVATPFCNAVYLCASALIAFAFNAGVRPKKCEAMHDLRKAVREVRPLPD